jgi:alkylation response protein AidB-like acyl-CoA dehydrogenase
MHFGLTEEQELLQQTVRQFVERDCAPSVMRSVYEGDAGRGHALWRSLVEIGIAGLIADEQHGGAGLELLDLALVAEELGRGAVPVPFLGHVLATLAVARGGSEAQKDRWLSRLAAGDVRGTIALGEAGGHWEPAEWTPSVSGDRVTGIKDFVPDGHGADLLVVGTAGGVLVLVDSTDGAVRVETARGVDRTRPIDVVHLDGARCDPLAQETAVHVRDAALVLLSADAFGVADRLITMSVDYANTRTQFGQPVGQFQALKHQLANMALAVHPTRSLWWYAAHAFDHVRHDATRAAALAKAHITDRAMEVARDAVEAHGGIGFTWECDVHIWFKRAMFDRLFLGTPEKHRERTAALGGW